MNKLVFAPGLLSGTTSANSGRLSVGAKSPLTYGAKESNVGGTASFKLARLRIKGIIVERKAEKGKIFYLLVNKNGAELHPAEELKGLKNYDLVEKLRSKYGEKVSIISIGPAGEMRLGAASIAVTDTSGNPSRHAGRGGLGAVMGSKGLKAIVVDDEDAPGIEYSDKDAFMNAAKTFSEALKSNPSTKPGGALAQFSTNVILDVINGIGGLPTRNFSEGKFDGSQKIDAKALRDTIEKRGGKSSHSACSNCIIQCSNVYVDDKANYITSALEYETIWANGANCGIDDLDSIAQVDRLCDEYGLDTIEVGCAIAVAMEAGIKEFGDAAGAIELMHEIGKGTHLGRVLGNGTAFTGKAFGLERAPVVKRQSLAGYDPRAIKGIGVTYATSPMGADHTAGYTIPANVSGQVNALKPEGQVELSRNLQVIAAALDAAGFCAFVAFAILDNAEGMEAVPKMLNARYGWEFTLDDITKYGQATLQAERTFNEAAGLSNKEDRLPDYFTREKLPPHDAVFDVPDEELDQVFKF
jgi:aldehyde:ferredoxin oxidoreductase